jgi:hypothetical protein
LKKHQHATTTLMLLATLLLLAGAALADSSATPSADASAAVTSAQPMDASAADSKPAAKPAAAAPKAEVKKPAALFEYGFEERVRSEQWNNIFNFKDSTGKFGPANFDVRHQIRFRSKVFFKVPSKYVDFYLRMGNEYRYFITPDDKTPVNGAALPATRVTTSNFDFDEVFFDNIWLEFKKMGIKGLSLKVGRMDFKKGDGLLFSDPSGVDGSRSGYNNMFDFSYKFRKGKSNLELIGILNPREDRMLPTAGRPAPSSTNWSTTRRMKVMDENDASSIGLYYTDKTIKSTDVEAFGFFFKKYHDLRAQTTGTGAARADNFQFQPDRHFTALGGRVTHRAKNAVTLVGEFAGELGSQRANVVGTTTYRQAADIRAWGGQAYVNKSFKHTVKPYIRLGWFALSGDDPKTPETNEGFDPMFNRTVTFGELTYYSLLSEGGLGYWTNMQAPFVEFGAKPHKRVGVKFVYWHKAAFNAYKTPAGAPISSIFGSGVNRGDNIWLRLDVPVTKNLATHLSYEKQMPGDFYTGKNGGYFFRLEALYTFKGAFLGKGASK